MSKKTVALFVCLFLFVLVLGSYPMSTVSVKSHWKVEKAVQPPHGVIVTEYQRAWKCHSDWTIDDSEWHRMQAVSSDPETAKGYLERNLSWQGEVSAEYVGDDGEYWRYEVTIIQTVPDDPEPTPDPDPEPSPEPEMSWLDQILNMIANFWNWLTSLWS